MTQILKGGEHMTHKQRAEVIENFIRNLDMMSGTGNGIGQGTVNRVKDFAVKYGFARKENV